jgi:hypothetical protein
MAARDRSPLRDAGWLAVLVASAATMGGCTEKKVCPDCFEQGYRIDLSAVPSSTRPPPAILFSGWRNGRCQDDLICTGTPDVFLGDIDGKIWDPVCDKEALAFAGGHAPTPATLVPSSPGSSVTLKPPLPLHISVWIVAGVLAPADAQDDVAKARAVFADLGSGIDIVADVKDFPSQRLAQLPDLESEAACTLAPQLSGMGTPPAGYDKGRINVYYVREFGLGTGTPAGVVCAYNSPPHQEIILVDGMISNSPVVLAHELGHALGLLRSVPLPGGGTGSSGHVNDLQLEPYLSTGNLMRSGGAYVGQITLGQIYRMHFDKLSWLWLAQSPGSDYPRECQNSPVHGGPCPPLTIHPSRGWP